MPFTRDHRVWSSPDWVCHGLSPDSPWSSEALPPPPTAQLISEPFGLAFDPPGSSAYFSFPLTDSCMTLICSHYLPLLDNLDPPLSTLVMPGFSAVRFRGPFCRTAHRTTGPVRNMCQTAHRTDPHRCGRVQCAVHWVQTCCHGVVTGIQTSKASKPVSNRPISQLHSNSLL